MRSPLSNQQEQGTNIKGQLKILHPALPVTLLTVCICLGHLDDDHMTIWTWTISVHLGDRFCESLAQLPSLSESEYYGKVE